MFSSTVRCGKQPAVLNDIAHLAAQCGLALGANWVPSQVIWPVVGSNVRFTMRSVVVLPQPGRADDHRDLAGRHGETEVDHRNRAIPECLAD